LDEWKEWIVFMEGIGKFSTFAEVVLLWRKEK
jgi:hypothetical protein